MSDDEKTDQQKPYEEPKLEKLGHMAQVTQKSGTGGDGSPSWPNRT